MAETYTILTTYSDASQVCALFTWKIKTDASTEETLVEEILRLWKAQRITLSGLADVQWTEVDGEEMEVNEYSLELEEIVRAHTRTAEERAHFLTALQTSEFDPVFFIRGDKGNEHLTRFCLSLVSED